MKKLPKSFQRILWSYDTDKMNTKEDKREIITYVLNYGTWSDLKLLYKLYSEKDIKEGVSHPQRGVWLEKVLNFWTKMLDITIKKEVYEKAIFRLIPIQHPNFFSGEESGERSKRIVSPRSNRSTEQDFIKPHQRTVWQEISPGERLRRSWILRSRFRNLKEIHDKKIFPRA